MKQIYTHQRNQMFSACLWVGLFFFFSYSYVTASDSIESFFLDRLFQRFEKVDQFERIGGIPATQDILVSQSYWLESLQKEQYFSANVFKEQERQGVVLATRSKDKVREYTKYIFNNTPGTEVKDVFTYAFRNLFSFVVTRYQTPAGTEEFSTTFSAYINKDANFAIESHWDAAIYTQGYDFYNFQVWADNMVKLELIVDDIINSLNLEAPIGEIYTTKEPGIFIAKQDFVEGMIVLDIVNKSGLKTASLSGQQRLSKSGKATDFNFALKLSGALKEKISLKNKGELTINGSLGLKAIKEIKPIDLGDGSWGTFHEDNQAKVDQFSILPIAGTHSIAVKALETGLEVKGTVKKVVTVYRTVYPKLFYSDFSYLDLMAFDYQSSHDLEVILIDARNKTLDDQPTYLLKASDNLKRTQLEKTQFEQKSGKNDWSMVKGIAFRFKGDQQNDQPFHLKINRIVFKERSK